MTIELKLPTRSFTAGKCQIPKIIAEKMIAKLKIQEFFVLKILNKIQVKSVIKPKRIRISSKIPPYKNRAKIHISLFTKSDSGR
jgi:hypothetical protein